MSAYAHPVASVYANMYADVHNTCLTYTPAHAWCAQHLWMHAYSPQQMHMHSCMRAYATVLKLLCHGSYCELILSLARASWRLSFAAHLPAISTKSVAWHCSLKKSIRIHASSWLGRRCSVAQTSFDHPHWCRPPPLCPWVALEAWQRGGTSSKILFSPSFQQASESWKTSVRIQVVWSQVSTRICWWFVNNVPQT